MGVLQMQQSKERRNHAPRLSPEQKYSQLMERKKAELRELERQEAELNRIHDEMVEWANLPAHKLSRPTKSYMQDALEALASNLMYGDEKALDELRAAIKKKRACGVYYRA